MPAHTVITERVALGVRAVSLRALQFLLVGASLLGCGASSPPMVGPERTALFEHAATWPVCTSAPNLASHYVEVDGDRVVVLHRAGRAEDVAPDFAAVRFRATEPTEEEVHVCDANAHISVRTNARPLEAHFATNQSEARVHLDPDPAVVPVADPPAAAVQQP